MKTNWLTCHVTPKGPEQLHPTHVWHHVGFAISGLLHFLLILAFLFTVSCRCKAKKTVTGDILDVTVVSTIVLIEVSSNSLAQWSPSFLSSVRSRRFCYSVSITVQERPLNTEYGNFFCHCCPKTLGRKRDNGLRTPCVDFFQSHEVQWHES